MKTHRLSKIGSYFANLKESSCYTILSISWVLFGLFMTVASTAEYQNKLEGFWFNLMLNLIVMVFLLIPLIIYELIVILIYKLLKIKKYISVWMLMPTVVMIFVISSTVFNAFFRDGNVSRIFAGCTGSTLPENRSHFKWYSDRGGLDSAYFFYFKTTPAETDRLIREMKFENADGDFVHPENLNNAIDPAEFSKHLDFERNGAKSKEALLLEKTENWPNYLNWNHPKKYRNHKEGFSVTLVTDEAKEQVLVSFVEY